MFTSKQDVLFIEKGVITLYRVSVGKKAIAQKIVALDWTPETIVTVLQKLRKTAKQKVRILLSDEFVYVLNIQIPSTTQLQQEVIRQTAQEFIPENLSDTVWSYKVVERTAKKDAHASTNIQIIVYTQLAATVLYGAFSKTSFKIELIESVSQSLSKLIKTAAKTILLIYIQQKSQLVVSERGVLVSSVLVSEVLDKAFVENYIDSLQKSHVAQLDSIIFSGQQPSFPIEKELKTIPVAAHMLDPIAALALRKDINNKNETDGKIIVYPQLASTANSANNKEDSRSQLGEIDSKEKPNSQKNTLIVITCIAIILISLVGWYVFQEQSKVDVKKDATTPTPVQVTTPQTPVASPAASVEQTASPSAELLSTYSITILNGSGREGEATTLKDTLTEKGYTIASVGNAEGDLLQQTEVRYKESVDENTKLTLDKDLKNLYSLNVGEIIESDNESDIVITIGIE